jgi:hypothetical protein
LRPDAYIGIDPGLNGCAVLLSDSRIEFYDFKTIIGAVNQIGEWLTVYTIKGVMLENPNLYNRPQKVKPGQTVIKGRSISTKFIRNIGQWEGILHSFYLKPVLVNPRTWQSRMVPKMPEKDPKKRSLIIASRMYPSVEKHLSMREHNNRSDALLIAAFCKKQMQRPKQLNL